MPHYTNDEVLERLYAIRDGSLDTWLALIAARDYRGTAALSDSFGKAVCELVRCGGDTASGNTITLNGIDLSKFVFGPAKEGCPEH